MPEEIPGSAPKLAGGCSHSKALPYGAFAMVALYWAAKYPPVDSVVPHIRGTMNTVAMSLIGMISWPSVKQAKTRLAQWCHIEMDGHVTVWFGKKREQPPP